MGKIAPGPRYTQCEGKVKHERYRDAYNSIRRQAKIRSEPTRKLSAYKCSYCGYFHIGKSSQRKVHRPNRMR